jgi:CTP:molybdopterin cytidylyltransferase MocA
MVTGVIQARGKSTRMGCEPKALMEFGGKSIIERACSGGEELFYKKEFDLVGMVVTLHGIRPDTRFNVVENAYRALKSEKRWAALDS